MWVFLILKKYIPMIETWSLQSWLKLKTVSPQKHFISESEEFKLLITYQNSILFLKTVSYLSTPQAKSRWCKTFAVICYLKLELLLIISNCYSTQILLESLCPNYTNNLTVYFVCVYQKVNMKVTNFILP